MIINLLKKQNLKKMSWKLKTKFEGKVIHSMDLLTDKQIKQIEEDTADNETGLNFFDKYFEKI